MFRLALAGGQTWHLAATQDRRDLLAEMARVMELGSEDSSEDASRLILAGTESVAALTNGNGDAQPVYEDAHVLVWPVQGRDDYVCEAPFDVTGDDFYQTLRSVVQIIHHRNAMRGGIPVHAALMEYEGRGVLLVAKGGTGKSTCCRRIPDHWRAWCDDEVLVVKNGSGDYLAHPFPTWSHFLGGGRRKTWFSERTVPLTAMFYLERGDEDDVTSLPAPEAALYLYHSIFPVYHRRITERMEAAARLSLNETLFHNCCDFALATPAFVLRASLHGRFWEKMEDVLDESNVVI